MSLYTARIETMTNIINLLRDKVADPANRGSNWIYPGFPRTDAKMPRISVSRLPTSLVEERVSGGTVAYVKFYFQIDVWVNIRDTFTIDGKTYQGDKLREYLTDRVCGAIFEFRSLLPRIFKVNITAPTQPLETEKDLDILREAVTIEAWYYSSTGQGTSMEIGHFDEVHEYNTDIFTRYAEDFDELVPEDLWDQDFDEETVGQQPSDMPSPNPSTNLVSDEASYSSPNSLKIDSGFLIGDWAKKDLSATPISSGKIRYRLMIPDNPYPAYAQDFEGLPLGQFPATAGPTYDYWVRVYQTIVPSVVNTMSHGGTQSVEFTGAAGQGNGIYRDMKNGSQKVSMWIYMESLSAQPSIAIYGRYAIPQVLNCQVLLSSSGTIRYLSGGVYVDTGLVAPVGVWFKLEIVPEYSTKTYSAYLNGSPLFEDKDLGQAGIYPQAESERFRFSVYGSTKVWLDDITFDEGGNQSKVVMAVPNLFSFQIYGLGLWANYITYNPNVQFETNKWYIFEWDIRLYRGQFIIWIYDESGTLVSGYSISSPYSTTSELWFQGLGYYVDDCIATGAIEFPDGWVKDNAFIQILDGLSPMGDVYDTPPNAVYFPFNVTPDGKTLYRATEMDNQDVIEFALRPYDQAQSTMPNFDVRLINGSDIVTSIALRRISTPYTATGLFYNTPGGMVDSGLYYYTTDFIKIRIELYLDQGTYDLYVDDALVAENIDLPVVNTVDKLLFYHDFDPLYPTLARHIIYMDTIDITGRKAEITLEAAPVSQSYPITVKGTRGGSPTTFILGTDYNIDYTTGVITFIWDNKPDEGTELIITYASEE